MQSKLLLDGPRVVSIYELFSKLSPFLAGYPWAEEALIDLWKMGAPDPSPNAQPCPPGYCRLKTAGRHECTSRLGCAMVRRVLLPQQFAAWWQDLTRRAGYDASKIKYL